MEFTTYHSLPDAARQIREAVFVREQGFQLEFDKTDETAVHIVAWDGTQPAAHHKRRMTCCTTQIDQTAFGQQEDRMTIRECIFINLRFDVEMLDARIVDQLFHLNLIIEVTNVADNSLIFHGSHVIDSDNITVSGSRYEDISLLNCLFHCSYLKTLHSSLQSTDRVDFGHQHTCTV